MQTPNIIRMSRFWSFFCPPPLGEFRAGSPRGGGISNEEFPGQIFAGGENWRSPRGIPRPRGRGATLVFYEEGSSKLKIN